MPRHYVRKSLRGAFYTHDDLQNAIYRVQNKELTTYGASKEYNIPVSTLFSHIKRRSTRKGFSWGRPTAVPCELETKLANGIKVLEIWGFALTKKEVFSIVEAFVRYNKICTPFKNGVPGVDWFSNFKKRHGLSFRKAQPIENVRCKNMDPSIVAKYFSILEYTIKKLNLEERPHLVWNLDETSVSLDPSCTTTLGAGKEHITILTAVSATGQKLTPLIVSNKNYCWDSWIDKSKDKYEFKLASSKKGCIDSDVFHDYVEKVLIPGLGKERPVLIVYDGHSTHVDIRVVEMALKQNIIIYKIPPFASHLLQPLNEAVFKSFKTSWDAKVVNWQEHHVGVNLPAKIFLDLFAEVWSNTEPETIINSFKTAGIHPFNSQVTSADDYSEGAYRCFEETQKTKDATKPPQDDSILQSLLEYPTMPAALSQLSFKVIDRPTTEEPSEGELKIWPTAEGNLCNSKSPVFKYSLSNGGMVGAVRFKESKSWQKATETVLNDTSLEEFDIEEVNQSDLDSDSYAEPVEECNMLLVKEEPFEVETLEEEPLLTSNKLKKRKASLTFNQYEEGVKCNCKSSEDEYDVFAKFVASQLRALGTERAVGLQLKMHHLLGEARIDALKGNSSEK